MKLSNKNIITIFAVILAGAIGYYLIVVQEIFKNKDPKKDPNLDTSTPEGASTYSDTCGSYHTNLKLGDNNKAVKELQSLITQTGSTTIPITGLFDSATEAVLFSLVDEKEISLYNYLLFMENEGIDLTTINVNYC